MAQAVIRWVGCWILKSISLLSWEKESGLGKRDSERGFERCRERVPREGERGESERGRGERRERRGERLRQFYFKLCRVEASFKYYNLDKRKILGSQSKDLSHTLI